MGPQGAVSPSLRSILQSYGRCSGRASATSFSMMSRYFLNFPGTSSKGSLPSCAIAETYSTTLASGSRHTVSSKDKENSAASYLVQCVKQLGLQNRSSSESQAICGGCLAIHQNGRKMSTSGSRGATSNTSLEKCFRCWRRSG